MPNGCRNEAVLIVPPDILGSNDQPRARRREDRMSLGEKERQELDERYAARRKRRKRSCLVPLTALLLAALLLTAGVLWKKKSSGGAPDSTLRPEASATAARVVVTVRPAQTPEPSPEPETRTPEPYVQEDGSVWQLRLVNAWNPLDASYAPADITELRNGQSVDSRCYPDLQALMDACRAEGNQPLICSSYRSYAKQQQLFNSAVNERIANGEDRETAESRAARKVARPGCSEHQLGLAVDIVDRRMQMLESEQEGTSTQRWLLQHSWEYGFVLRFPKDKEAITGVDYEPWHYRYVGKEAAAAMHGSSLCLEEYLAQGPAATAFPSFPPPSPTPSPEASAGSGRQALEDAVGYFPLRLFRTFGQEMIQFSLEEDSAVRAHMGPTFVHEKKEIRWTFQDGVLTLSGPWEERFRLDRNDDGPVFVSEADGAVYRIFPPPQ